MADYGNVSVNSGKSGNLSTRSYTKTPMLIENLRTRNLDEMQRSATNPLESRSLQEAERAMRESVSQMVREKLRKGSGFGIEGYNLPSYNPQHKQHFGIKKWTKDKIPSMQDIIAKKAMSTPSPDKYSQHLKLQVPKNYAGFSKVKRVTYIDNLIKDKKKIPAPSDYTPVLPKSRKSFF